MELAPRITIDKDIRVGRPVVKGTRVPIDLILGKLAGGMTYDDLISEYEIEREDILAVLDYAAKHFAVEEVKAFA